MIYSIHSVYDIITINIWFKSSTLNFVKNKVVMLSVRYTDACILFFFKLKTQSNQKWYTIDFINYSVWLIKKLSNQPNLVITDEIICGAHKWNFKHINFPNHHFVENNIKTHPIHNVYLNMFSLGSIRGLLI